MSLIAFILNGNSSRCAWRDSHRCAEEPVHTSFSDHDVRFQLQVTQEAMTAGNGACNTGGVAVPQLRIARIK